MRKLTLLFLATLSIFVVSCSKENLPAPPPMPKPAIVVYLAGANSLSADLRQNINDIRDNYKPSANKELYIFYKGSTSTYPPTLYRVKRNSDGNGANVLIEVKRYSQSVSSTSEEMIDEVLSDVLLREDVSVIADLVLSSHSSSWIPNGISPVKLSNETRISQYSFGEDTDFEPKTININDLAEVLKKYNLNSIIFDSCFMGSVEVFYEFRNCAKYILASPAEVLADGFNYKGTTKYLSREFTLEVLSEFAAEVKRYYMNYNYVGDWSEPEKTFIQSITLTISDSDYMEELAQEVKKITDKYSSLSNNINAAPTIRYDGRSGYAKDYKQYLDNLISMYGNSAERAPLDAVWAKAFPTYHHSPMLFNKINLTGSSGVAGYIYRTDVNATVNNYYKTLEWAKAINQPQY